MAGTIAVVMEEITGDAVEIRAEAETLTTGDAVGTSPFSVTRGIDDRVESEGVVACSESSEITALATIYTTGTDCVTSPDDAEAMTKEEVTPFFTIAIEDPEVAIEYVVPSTTIPDPPAEMV
jgi:hypothetical protein